VRRDQLQFPAPTRRHIHNAVARGRHAVDLACRAVGARKAPPTAARLVGRVTGDGKLNWPFVVVAVDDDDDHLYSSGSLMHCSFNLRRADG